MPGIALVQIELRVIGQAGKYAGRVTSVEGGIVAPDEGLGGGGHATVSRRPVGCLNLAVGW